MEDCEDCSESKSFYISFSLISTASNENVSTRLLSIESTSCSEPVPFSWNKDTESIYSDTCDTDLV